MGDDEVDRTLWCGNLDSKVTEELLFELFLQAGPLESVKIAGGKDGVKKNFSFIRFKHKDSVPYTIDLMNNIRLHGRSLRLQFRPGSIHEQKERQQSVNQGMMGPPSGGAFQMHRSFSSPSDLNRFGDRQAGKNSPSHGGRSPLSLPSPKHGGSTDNWSTPDSGRRGRDRHEPYSRPSRDQRGGGSPHGNDRYSRLPVSFPGHIMPLMAMNSPGPNDSRDSRGSRDSRDSRDDRDRDSRDNRDRSRNGKDSSRGDYSRGDNSRDNNSRNRNNSSSNRGNDQSSEYRSGRMDQRSPMTPGGAQMSPMALGGASLQGLQSQYMQAMQNMNPQNRFMQQQRQQQQQQRGDAPPWHSLRGGRQNFN